MADGVWDVCFSSLVSALCQEPLELSSLLVGSLRLRALGALSATAMAFTSTDLVNWMLIIVYLSTGLLMAVTMASPKDLEESAIIMPSSAGPY